MDQTMVHFAIINRYLRLFTHKLMSRSLLVESRYRLLRDTTSYNTNSDEHIEK